MFVHQWDIRVKDLSIVFYAVNTASSIYAASMGCLKSSILLDWMRTFSPRNTRGYFFWACQALMWLNICYYTIALIVGNLTCRPYRRIWDKTVPGTCMDRRDLDTSSAVINVVSHFLVLILPHSVIWKLQMKWKAKLGISLVFAIGILACAAAILRLIATINYLHSDDTTYSVCGMAFWCAAELTCVLLVLCVPSLPKTFRETRVLNRILRSWRSLTDQLSKRSRKAETEAWETSSDSHLTGSRGVGGDGLRLMDVALPGVSSGAQKSLSKSPNQTALTVSPPPARIVRTTHVETTEEAGGTQTRLHEHNSWGGS
ncbi:hypothetical protein PG990_009013 [Apiospora arundinis]